MRVQPTADYALTFSSNTAWRRCLCGLAEQRGHYLDTVDESSERRAVVVPMLSLELQSVPVQDPRHLLLARNRAVPGRDGSCDPGPVLLPAGQNIHNFSRNVNGTVAGVTGAGSGPYHYWVDHGRRRWL